MRREKAERQQDWEEAKYYQNKKKADYQQD